MSKTNKIKRKIVEKQNNNNTEDVLKNNLQIMEKVENVLNKRKAESTFCFSVFLIVMSIWVFLVKLWEDLGRPIEPSTMTYGVEIIAVIMFIITQIKTRIKPENIGLNFKNIKKTMFRAIILSVLIIIVMIIFRLIINPHDQLFDFSKYNMLYPFTSVLQEFLARGFIMSCLSNIYEKKNKNKITIIISSLLFATMHLYYGFAFMVGAWLLSMILGYIYIKDKNIWGVSLVHFLFGTMAAILSLI